MEDLIEARRQKIQELRAKNIDPYGRKFVRTGEIKSYIDNFKEGEEVSVRGRIMTYRGHGKAIFCDLYDMSGKIQIYVKHDKIGPEKFVEFKCVDIGDIIGVKGGMFKTHTGELTIFVSEFVILSKALRPLPEKWHGLKDVETRYRQRYLDLIVNKEVRDLFIKRTKIIAAMRRFLDDECFLEVETPMMQQLPGGATARPFVTHHTALGINLYLRIAPELYLKRLLVGGFEKVYEINRNFRNEGISRVHNPEFTMMEVYAAYEDCAYMMELTERIITHVAEGVLGGINYPAASCEALKQRNKEPLPAAGNLPPVPTESSGLKVSLTNGTEIDFSLPWKRHTFYGIIKENTGIDFNNEPKENYKEIAKKLNISIEKDAVANDIIDEIFKHYVEKRLIQPTFITEYPVEMCPLAKSKPDNPKFCERFELFINGMEIANAYSELNDPAEQKKRFLEQVQNSQDGNKNIDEDYVEALEYGMPPAGGLGIGIDRLVMMLAGVDSIREVILFPQLKPVETQVEHLD